MKCDFTTYCLHFTPPTIYCNIQVNLRLFTIINDEMVAIITQNSIFSFS